MFRVLNKRTLLASAVMAAVGVSFQAEAQMMLEEVMVTARKKEESLADAPLSVSAITQSTIESSFLGNAAGIVQYSPNLVFDDISAGTPGGGGISIRGISFQDVEKTFDPTVLIHLDGVPLGTNTGNVMSLLDIERIEILRGPQGTLFGKNAVGGVVNIYRVKPTPGEWGGKVRAMAEDYDGSSVEGYLNVPLGDNAAVKLNAARVESPEYYKSTTTGDRQGDSTDDRYGIHGLWDVTDSLRIEGQYNYSDQDGTLPPMLNTSDALNYTCAVWGQCGNPAGEPISGNRLKGSNELKQDFKLKQTDYQVDVNWELTDSFDTVLLAAHRDTDESTYIDFDGSPLVLFEVYRPNKYEQDSVEWRLNYDAGENLSFTTGYFYWNAKLKNWTNEAAVPDVLGVPLDACGLDRTACVVQTANAESDSDSFFFEGDYRFADTWTVTAGARYIEETKKISKMVDLPIFNVVSLPETNGKRTDNDTIYRLGLRWEPTDDLMAYALYSSGWRSGGFSIRGATPEVLQTGFKPETLDNYEAGIKTSLLDNRMRLSAAVFYMEYDDMQQEVNIPGGATGNQDAVLNVGSATLQGVELETTVILGDYFSLDFNGGYLDASYDEFKGRLFGGQSVDADNSNLDMRRAPKWTYTAALNYQQDVYEGTLTGRVSYNWRDSYEGTVTNWPNTKIDAYGTLDASLSYEFGNWRIGAFGRNLTDEDQYSHTFVAAPNLDGSSQLIFTTPRPPRTYGMELVYQFGEI